MRLRRLITAALLTAGAFAGSVLYRRRRSQRWERIDLYADDGTRLSISESSPEGRRLLALAHELVVLGRP